MANLPVAPLARTWSRKLTVPARPGGSAILTTYWEDNVVARSSYRRSSSSGAAEKASPPVSLAIRSRLAAFSSPPGPRPTG